MMKRAVAVLLVLALFSLAAGPAQAEDYSDHAGRGALTKLFRGIVNAATGWIEIPKQMIVTGQESGPAKGWTWGFAKGIGWAVARSVVGAYEIVTFPVPVPEGYRHIMDPEYVLSDMESGTAR